MGVGRRDRISPEAGLYSRNLRGVWNFRSCDHRTKNILKSSGLVWSWYFVPRGNVFQHHCQDIANIYYYLMSISVLVFILWSMTFFWITFPQRTLNCRHQMPFFFYRKWHLNVNEIISPWGKIIHWRRFLFMANGTSTIEWFFISENIVAGAVFLLWKTAHKRKTAPQQLNNFSLAKI